MANDPWAVAEIVDDVKPVGMPASDDGWGVVEVIDDSTGQAIGKDARVDTDKLAVEQAAYERDNPFFTRIGQRLTKGAKNLTASSYSLRAANAAGGIAKLSNPDLAEAGERRLIEQLKPEERQAALLRLSDDLAGQVAETIRLHQESAAIPGAPVFKAGAGKSFKENVRGAMVDPVSWIAEAGLTSAPASLAMLAPAALGARRGKSGAMTGGFAGSYLVDYASEITEALSRSGVDTSNPEAIKQALLDPPTLAKIRSEVSTGSAAVGVFDALSLGVASKVLAPAKLGRVTREAINIPAQVGVQGAMGGAGEATKQVARSGEIDDPQSVLAEIGGEAFMAPADVATMAATGLRKPSDVAAVQGLDRAYQDTGTPPPTPPSGTPPPIGARVEPTIDPAWEAIETLPADIMPTEAVPPITPAATPYIDTAEPGAQPLAPQNVPPAPEAVDIPYTEIADDQAYVDPRLKRQNFRELLQKTVDEDFVKGGGTVLIPDPDFRPGESDKPGEIPLIRTPSLNAPWIQSLLADTGLSVEQVRQAAKKAVDGKPLGVRQARVVQAVLDQITGERTDPANLDAARQQLEDARAVKRQLHAQLASHGEVEALAEGLPDIDGERYAETEYSPEIDALNRVIVESADEARLLGADAGAIEDLLSSNVPDAEILRELIRHNEGLKREQAQQTQRVAPSNDPNVQAERQGETLPQATGTTQEPVPAAGPLTRASRVAQPDLFGGKSETQQAVHDAGVARQQAERAAPPVEEGPGDLFNDRSKQTDIEDVAKPAKQTDILASKVTEAVTAMTDAVKVLKDEVKAIREESKADQKVATEKPPPQPKAKTEPTAPPPSGVPVSVDTAAQEAATSTQNDMPQPTEAQKDAGNYTKGHVTIGGLDVTIENPEGSKRRPEWPPLKSHYGYFKRSEGKDGDQVDVFVKPGTPEDYSGPVFVIDQTNKDGGFDEHKVMLGFDSAELARAGYLENYTKGWTGLGAMRKFSLGEFKMWLKSGGTKKPVALKGKKLVPADKATPAPSEKPADEKAAAPEPKPESAYGAKNKIVTQARADEIRAKLKAKLNQLSAGIDPEVMALGTELATFHVEAGARKFTDFSKAMVKDLGEKIRPYLKALYLAARNWPGIDKAGMNTEAEIELQDAQAPKEPDITKAKEAGGKTAAEYLLTKGLGVRKTKTNKGNDVWEVTGTKRDDTATQAAIKALGGRWYGPKKAWSFYNDDPTEKLAARLGWKGKTEPSARAPAAETQEAAPGDLLSPDWARWWDKELTRVGRGSAFQAVGMSPDRRDRVAWEHLSDHERSKVAALRRSGWNPDEAEQDAVLTPAAAGSTVITEETTNVADVRPRDTKAGDRSGDTRTRSESGADHRPLGDGLAEADAGTREAGDTPGEIDKPSGSRESRDTREQDVASSGPRDSGTLGTESRAAVTPTARRHNYTITNADALGAGGLKTKYKQNVAAIRLVKQLMRDGRRAAPDEQAVLAKYVGWGGIKGVFDPDNKDWTTEHSELRELLTDDEYDAARRSMLDAHYTSVPIVRGIWAGLERMGFTGGRVLEPSVGTGNFIGLMPPAIRSDSSILGVELDNITGQIARQLYQRADIASPRGFQDITLPPNSFDAIIGNPPFGNQKLYDKGHPELASFSIHNFFIAKSIDKLRPGGVAGFVVSRYFMDAVQSQARALIAGHAKLIGAVRLPYTAFKGNANTEVVTDVLFFQRLKDGEKTDTGWTSATDIEVNGKQFPVNSYFVANPDNVIGRYSTAGTMYAADSLTVEPVEGQDIEAAIREAVARLPENVYQPYKPESAGAEVITDAEPIDGGVPDTVKVGAYFVTADGKLARRTTDGSKTDEAGNPERRHVLVSGLPEATEKRIRGIVSVREALRDLIRAELSDASNIAELRLRLNRRYDDFVKAHGYINSTTNRRAFQEDPELPLLESLEPGYDQGVSPTVAAKNGVEPRKPKAKKAAIFTTRVLSPYTPTLHADNPQDALAASLNENGKVDLDYMSNITGIDSGALTKELAGLIFFDPADSRWATADEYLTGNVKAKLADAKAAAAKDAKFQGNVEALERVQPPDLKAVDISVRLGSPWVPGDVIADFGKELLKTDSVRVSYQATVGMWGFVANGVPQTVQTATWGTRRVDAADLIRDVLNMKSPVVKDNKGTSHDPAWVINEPETQAAQAKAEDIANRFKEWIWEDAKRRERLEKIYNENYNTNRTRVFDGRHMRLPGSSPLIKLEDHQKDAVWRMVQERRVLLDHVVGAGKTYASVAAVMEMRRLGIARKPVIAVPNHLVRQWRDDFYRLYPNANILAATEKDFEKKNRQRLFSGITTGDWDAVIVGHSSFKKIAMPPDVEKRMLDEQLNEIADAIEVVKRERGDRNIIRDMERMKERINAKLQRLADQGDKDKAVSFDELGIDALLVDEAHAYKNLYYFSQMRGVAGLGSPDGSERAFDLFIKIRYLNERYGGKGVTVFATGTPISNSLVEMYTMQRYLAFDELKARGIHQLDSWARVFGDVQNVYEVHPSGTGYRLKSRFAKFVNMPELMSLYRTFADVVTLDDLKKAAAAQGNRWPTPKIKGGKPQLIVVDRSRDQEAFFGVPELKRGHGGAIVFKYGNLKVQEVPPQGDGTGIQYEVISNQQRAAGPFDTRKEAEEEADRLVDIPVMQYTKGSILDQFENLRELTKKTDGKINALSLTTRARKAGLDMRLIDPKYPDHPESKVNRAVSEMLRVHKAWTKDRGTQLVFLDFSTPASHAKNAASTERNVWVRDKDNGGIMEIKATLHTVEGVDGAAFYLQQTGKGDGAKVIIWDAITGVRVGTIDNRKEAKAYLSKTVAPEWLVEQRGETVPLTQDVINDLRDTKDADETDTDVGDDKLSLEELFVMSSGAAFSVYDDIKAKLIANGIPEREIAFIHDYPTADKKSKLYESVNAGDIRFLLGSTEKMGAGMNVQKRLVALHHLDAPWRPSDLEQREGRIIRRGNTLFERDPDGFEVEILRYATKQTYDTRMWQIIEHKARGVEQLRRADSTARVVDDVSGEAANAADMKAAASGNPLILDEIKLRNEIKSLEAQEQAHNRSLFDLQTRAGFLERADERFVAKRGEADAWIAYDKANPDDPFKYKTAKGKVMAERKDVGGPLNAAVGEAIKSAYSTEVDGGEYRGLKVTFTRERGYDSELLIANVTRPGHKRVRVAEYGAKDTFSATGLLTRIDNYLKGFAADIPKLERARDDEKAELERVKTEVAKPFERKGQLQEARIKHRNVLRALQKAGGIVEYTPEQKAELEDAIAKRRAERGPEGEAKFARVGKAEAQEDIESLLSDKRLSGISVKIKAIEAETGRAISYNEKADVALTDVNQRIAKAKALLECLSS